MKDFHARHRPAFFLRGASTKRVLHNVLAAGAEPAYMKCVFDSYTDFTAGRLLNSDEVFDNLPAIVGRKPRTLADFANRYADKFRY
jgi:NAD(P)H dehydrogenase (quinone)